MRIPKMASNEIEESQPQRGLPKKKLITIQFQMSQYQC